jgi:hypothetical protein
MPSEQSPENHNKSRPEKPINLADAYKRALEVIGRHSLKLRSFTNRDGSNRETIEDDLKMVANKKEEFAKKAASKTEWGRAQDIEWEMLSKCLEAAFLERVNGNSWLGKGVRLIKLSDYDDIENGLDFVLEFNVDDKSQLNPFLGIDITYHHDPSDKFRTVKGRIDRSKLGTVKYFRNYDNTSKKSISNLPIAVIVISAEGAERIVRDWHLNSPQAESFGKIILEQLEMQMAVYRNYAKGIEVAAKKGKKPFVVSRFFEGVRANIVAQLQDISNSTETRQREKDSSLKLVRDNLTRVFMPEITQNDKIP